MQKMTARDYISETRELHIKKINDAIDAIIELEDYYPLPSELSSALSKLNSLRNLAEEEFEVGDKVWHTHTKTVREVSEVGAINLFFNDDDKDHCAIGTKFCFKMHY